MADRFVDLVEEGVDLAVRIARLEDSSLVSRKLSSTRLVLCASPKYLKKHGRLRHPADLARHAVIAYSLLSVGDDWQFTGPQGSVQVTNVHGSVGALAQSADAPASVDVRGPGGQPERKGPA